MSYDLYLYEKPFLKRALEENLGDWTEADPIPEETSRRIRERLRAKGYLTDDGNEFNHPNEAWGIQVCCYRGEVGFSIAYGDEAADAVEAGRAEALEMARETGLGFYDPQTGEATIE